MYRLLVVLLIVGVAGWAFAGDDGAMYIAPVKDSTPVTVDPGTGDGREGGETIGTAVPIPSLPFFDVGNTCDNINDYDVACPYSGSTSPDVVYSYTPSAVEIVQIDLCNSSYDTKVYVYDSAMGVVGCNDDFYFAAPCYTYSSFLEVTLNPGQTYYIVIDGYGGACGAYDLVVTGGPYIPCVIECLYDALPEGEPALVPNYVDNYNGGCNATPNVFQPGNWIHIEDGCLHMAGVSGWFPVGTSQYRDTDWIQIVAAGPQVTVTITTDNELTLTRCMMTTVNPTCTSYGYSFQSSTIPECEPTSWTVPTVAGGIYWVFVAPAAWIDGPLEFNYCLDICGIQYAVIGNEDNTWGGVKSMFK